MADDADQALGHDGNDGTCDEEGLDADIDEAGDGTWGIVGVECAENQVSGEGGLDGDFGGFRIADFTDEDDVRGLAQHGADDSGEIEPDFVFHFDLIDTWKVILDGVFCGDDFLVWAVHLVECGVERGGFAGACGTGDQEDAVGAFDDVVEAGVIGFAEAQVFDADIDVAAVEDAHDAGLAMAGWEHADAHVEVFAAQGEFDSAVLAAAFLGDIHLRENLKTRDDRNEQRSRRRNEFLQRAVVGAVVDEDKLPAVRGP